MIERRVEQRERPRTEVAIEVEVAFPGGVIRDGYARNISHEGAYVELGGAGNLGPGTELMLTFRIWTGSGHICRLARARVVRCAPGWLALVFTERDLVARAVVEDIRFYKDHEHRRRPRNAAPAHKGCPTFPA